MLIDNPDFYTMTVAMLTLLLKLHKIRAGNEIDIHTEVESRFQPKAHFRLHLHNFWLLCFLGAPVEALMQFSDNAITQFSSTITSCFSEYLDKNSKISSADKLSNKCAETCELSSHARQCRASAGMTDTHILLCSSYAGFSNARFSWI